MIIVIYLVRRTRFRPHFGVLTMVLLYLFCGFCAASGQQGDRHHQCHKHGKHAVQCSFVHQIVLLTTLGQLSFCTPEYRKKA